MKNDNRYSGIKFVGAFPMLIGKFGAVLLFVMMSLMFADVVGRYFLNSPIGGAYELTEILLACVVFFALPLVTQENGHITVALLDKWFGGTAIKIKKVLLSLMVALIQGVMTWRLYLQAGDLSIYGDVSMYLNIPYSWVAYMMTLMAAVSTLYVLSSTFSATDKQGAI